jgi:glycosyltransferase involved in cell wall biosynthesis
MFNLPEDRFCFLPFKSNHSKRPSYHLPMDNFIFSGGNGKRDYACLIEAVQDTGIPVIISATDPSVRKELKHLPNVMVLGAPEPAYAQLTAASRFVVVPMIYSGVKGGAEAFFCDGMWHSKAVVASCSIAAEDYIDDGETGYVVQAGDSEGLRKRIVELWNDPEKCKEMGRKGRKRCEKYFTHESFIRRCLRLALVVFDEYNERRT